MKKLVVALVVVLVMAAYAISAFASPAQINKMLLNAKASSAVGDEIAYINDVATYFSPIFMADLYRYDKHGVNLGSCDYNIPTLASFDGDWDALNNEYNYNSLIADYPEIVTDPGRFRHLGIANIYYEAISTESHIFITYYLFYPHDAGDNCKFTRPTDPGGHLNDASSLMTIVRVDGKETKLEYVITQDHGEINAYWVSDIMLIDDRPVVYIESGQHAMIVYAPEDEIPEAEISYRYGMEDAYDLMPIYPTLWAERGNSDLFCDFLNDIGMRYCEEADKAPGRGTPPWAPWAREFSFNEMLDVNNAPGLRNLAESYVDPINAFRSLYKKNNESYSLLYWFNPYMFEY